MRESAGRAPVPATRILRVNMKCAHRGTRAESTDAPSENECHNMSEEILRLVAIMRPDSTRGRHHALNDVVSDPKNVRCIQL